MNSCSSNIVDGVSQSERLPDILRPENVKVDDRSLGVLLRFVYEMAGQIRYYNQENQPQGNWQQLLQELEPNEKLESFLAQYKSRQDHPAHLALLISCLKLYQIYQRDLNQFTERHLDFFFQEVLDQTRKPAEKDHAHLVIQLAKHTDSLYLERGVKFQGKDSTGQIQLFESVRPTPLNKVIVSSLKNLFQDEQGRFWTNEHLDNQTELKDISQAVPWSMFGTKAEEQLADLQIFSTTRIGFAISAPDLYLTAGNRKLVVDIAYSAPDGVNFSPTMRQALEVRYSTEEGWSEPLILNLYALENPSTTPSVSAYVFGDIAGLSTPKLRIGLNLSPEDPPILPAEGEAFGEFQSPWPVLQVFLRQESPDYAYSDLIQIQPEAYHIAVDVKNFDSFVYQNDLFVRSGDAPFSVFTNRPGLGSNLYLGSAEVFRKPLKTLDLKWEWFDKPDFATYYQAYEKVPQPPSSTAVITDDSFLSSFSIRKGGVWHTANATDEGSPTTDIYQVKLFQNELIFDFGTASLGMGYTDEEDPGVITEFNKELIEDLSPLAPFDETTKNGYIRLQLTGPTEPFRAFGHADFSRVFSSIAIAKAVDSTNQDPLPNLAYTPHIQKLTADYTAARTFSLGDPDANIRFFHLLPFGSASPALNEDTPLLPVFSGERYFYLSLDQISPPQTVSLLFKVAEGTAQINSTADLPNPEDFVWSYLAGETWIDFPPQAIEVETTSAFKTTGIVQLSIPEDASTAHLRMPEGQVWIRVGFQGAPNAVNHLIAIHTQAVEVTRILEPNSTQALRLLPAESINKLLRPQASIKGIRQAYASFGGRNRESKTGFYTRVAEQFRHKNRAVSKWDYERIVLEHFPEIYKAKCIPHTVGENSLSPRSLSVVVIPNTQIASANNPLQPKADALTLDRIQLELLGRTAPNVQVFVENPVYEEVLLDFRVRFRAGFDVGLSTDRLNSEIVRFLSPWAFEEGQDIVIGGRFLKSDIIRFIEGRPYVEFVKEFHLYHLIPHVSPCPGLGEMRLETDFSLAPQRGPGIGEMYIQPQGDPRGADNLFLLRLETSLREEIIPELIAEGLTPGDGEYEDRLEEALSQRTQEELQIAQQLGHYHPGIDRGFTVGQSLELATASSTRSVLVSASKHRIDPIPPSEPDCISGIGFGLGVMRIEIDFEVNETELLDNLT